MEADALPIGPILKGVKELVEHTPGIVKVQTGKTTLVQTNNWCKQNQESCTANNEIMYKELSFDKYGIKSLQIPSGWEVNLHEVLCDDGVCTDHFEFTDGRFPVGGYLIVSYSDTAGGDGAAYSLESILNPRGDLESLKKEIEEEVKREIRNSSFQIIEVEEDVDRYVLKYTMFVRELPGLDRQEHLGKIVVIEEDSFAYMFWFHYQNQSEFASNADVYDHIEKTFVTSHQSFWQNVLGLIAIIIAIGFIIAFVARRITSSKKSKKKTKKKN